LTQRAAFIDHRMSAGMAARRGDQDEQDEARVPGLTPSVYSGLGT
jgi:hypothetical protein